MTLADIQRLKDHIDKLVEIRTVRGERLVARVLFVMDCDEYDEHEVLYEVVSSNQIDQYRHLETSGGYVLYFEEIVSVKPAPSLTPNP
jgi:hypothetical protein